MIYFFQILIVFVFVFGVSTQSLSKLNQSLEILGTPKSWDRCGHIDTSFSETDYRNLIEARGNEENECVAWCATGAVAELRKYIGKDKEEGRDNTDPRAFAAMYKTLVCCSDQAGINRRLVHLSILSCEVGDLSGRRYNYLIPNYYHFEKKEEEDVEWELHSEIIALCYAWGLFSETVDSSKPDQRCVMFSQAKPCPWCQRASLSDPRYTRYANYDHTQTYTIYPMKNSCVWSFTQQVSNLLRDFITATHKSDHQSIAGSETPEQKDVRRKCMEAFNFYPLRRKCLGQSDRSFFTPSSGMNEDGSHFVGRFAVDAFPWGKTGDDYIGNEVSEDLTETECLNIDRGVYSVRDRGGRVTGVEPFLKPEVLSEGNHNVINILLATEGWQYVQAILEENNDVFMIE